MPARDRPRRHFVNGYGARLHQREALV